MTNNDKHLHIPWIGVVISALIMGAIGRFAALKVSGDIGTANLVFIIVLGGIVLLYLLIQELAEPLFSILFKRIKIRSKPAVPATKDRRFLPLLRHGAKRLCCR